jgi:UDP-N-acetyl-D-galactosamine dehydrogenase
MKISKEIVVGVIGLGYVGLPLAVEFGKKFRTIGFDLSVKKIEAYKQFIDPTGELDSDTLRAVIGVGGLEVTSDPESLSEADFLIIAVPTPVDQAHIPDFTPLISATKIVGQNMKSGATVIYESTVYPGATEEICIPILEQESRMEWGVRLSNAIGDGRSHFFVGYSPERINPGDKEHTLTKIIKVVSGDCANTLQKIAGLYETIINAGVYKASSIKVAEAAKVIENTQRDLNIALINELAIICDRIGIKTLDVLDAAGTKWNFLKFKPGLVGGHCIGVDPYYLTHKAEMLGYHPEVILAGRRINDGMGKFIAEKTIKLMIRQGMNVSQSKIIVMGLTFKEDCPDLRNSKVIDVIQELQDYGCEVFVHDPISSPEQAQHEYGIELVTWDELPVADAIVATVPHRQYITAKFDDISAKLKGGGIFMDIKSAFCSDSINKRDYLVWNL